MEFSELLIYIDLNNLFDVFASYLNLLLHDHMQFSLVSLNLLPTILKLKHNPGAESFILEIGGYRLYEASKTMDN